MFQEILQGGNSGGGSRMTYTELLPNIISTNGTYTLNDDISNYDAIIVTMAAIYLGNYVNKIPQYITKNAIATMSRNEYEFFIGASAYVDNLTQDLSSTYYSFPTNTSIKTSLMQYNSKYRSSISIISVIGCK